ncbi:MAG: preprotein translocase subunit SecE [Wenzhouxiangellaceae bacterium]|nr:preprotein translocase subunit SecE [Wenzhouxiangellaceae bacterium]MBS3747212.1 preprotein translocase subunit SecE [Wenzhouxiangellaceae bacterium]MBS3823220.1 preprotein translocase subunit SecE [Wenzhouxiangellaceae bacterium]
MAAEKNTSSDIVMWILAALVFGAGVYGFVYFEGQAMTLIRVLGLVAAVGVALFIAAQTAKGRESLSYVREVDVERRKVVWPTRQETVQTTLIVLAVTVVVAIILFLMDTVFGGLVRWLIGMGGDL